MELTEYFVVFLRKGPAWTPTSSPALDQLQAGHLAHLDALRKTGQLTLAGPVEVYSNSDLRGISVFPKAQISDLAGLKRLVEDDPMFQRKRLVAEYATWFLPAGSQLG